VSTQVVPVQATMFQDVYDEILRELNPRFDAQRWRSIFDWPWENPRGNVGYALVEDTGRVVGFAGFVYSRQWLGNAHEVVCNITSLMVREPYRAGAMALLMPALRQPDLTVTVLTSIPAVASIFTRLGFGVLETHTRVFLPSQIIGGYSYHVAAGATASGANLPDPVRQVAQDHIGIGEQLVVEGPEGSCLLIYTKGRRRGVGSARVHYLSDPSVFKHALPAIQRWLLTRRGLPLLECDARLSANCDAPFTLRIPLQVPRLYRSRTLQPSQISNAYSETVLLNI
jgi:hypothetical protein